MLLVIGVITGVLMMDARDPLLVASAAILPAVP